MNDRKILVLCFGFLILFFGAVFITEYINKSAYQSVLDPARAVVLSDLEMSGIEVLHESPDWDNLMGLAIMNTDSYNVFKTRCLWENSSAVYHDDETGFYVIVSKYNQVWEYSIIISKHREPLNPFYTYTWENR